MKIKINKNIRSYKAGQEIEIKTDKDNVPLDRYWRNRLRDSKIDNCIEIINTQPKKK
jgi:hypothetical protein